ncbi:S1 RNA-binding domain-containing protein [Spirulina major CS-329]|uniref:S1 RNA-binding domain-containing protein n=1 Tax=Spirulina TaxID=1154 RepID=UPI00232F1D84|nr:MULTISPECIES: S1 RNA-binding domain-containing protein [Spirulina]MDB9493192.1 S1 RNA-binding domain-containing protein [Spirulina subsalsa CS-330]MDB9501970.1 S1 RNA-binding domain-containing protein [Spirulina major CS-329]
MTSPSSQPSFSMDDFAQALEKESYTFNFERGSVVTGKVFEYTSDGAFVDIGGKAAGFIPIDEIAVTRVSNLEAALPQDEALEFLIIRDQDADGQVILSRRQLAIQQLWQDLEALQDEGKTLEMQVTGSNRGGLMGQVYGLRAFIPRSHLLESEKQLLNDGKADVLTGQTLTVTCLEVSQERRKLVLSQRNAARTSAMKTIEIGALLEGTVVNLQPYGAFVDVGGLTGLLHVKQISRNTVQAPSTVLSIGQAIKVVVLDVDEQKNRLSFATKVLERYPGELLEKFDAVMADAEERLQAAQQQEDTPPAPAATPEPATPEPEAATSDPAVAEEE